MTSQPWTHHDDQILKRLYPHDDIEGLAELLGRTPKSVYHRAQSFSIARAKGPYENGYELRIVRAADGLIMYQKVFHPSKYAKKHMNTMRMQWQELHYNKLITGEWEISVINGFDAFVQ